MKGRVWKGMAIVLLAFTAAYLGGWAYRAQQQDKLITAQNSGYTAGGFTLQSADGERSLSDYAGRVVLIYFGYTYCPDVCPTSLAIMAEAMRQLEGEHAVKGLLITIDPERDTPEKLKAYAPFFHPQISGLTSSGPRILEVSTRYGVYFQKVEREDKDYLMDHTSKIYVIDQQGALAGVLGHGVTPGEIVERVRRLL